MAITHLAFSNEYAKAVEAKQVAQQEAELAKYIVIGALSEKQTIITKAVKRNPGFVKFFGLMRHGILRILWPDRGIKCI